MPFLLVFAAIGGLYWLGAQGKKRGCQYQHQQHPAHGIGKRMGRRAMRKMRQHTTSKETHPTNMMPIVAGESMDFNVGPGVQLIQQSGSQSGSGTSSSVNTNVGS